MEPNQETKKTARPKMTRFVDVRRLFHDDEARLSRTLLKDWPTVPSTGRDSATSGLDCAVILCGAVFSRTRPENIPDISESDSRFVQYVFSHFNQEEPGYADRVSQLAKKALRDATEGMKDDIVPSFARLCRCQGMVDLIWGHPRYRLTQPWVLHGPGQPRGGTVCKSGEEISRDGVLQWDGARPEAIEELVSSVTRTEAADGAGKSGCYKAVYFNSPQLLQLELSQGQGSQCSLMRIWRFWADTYIPGPADGDKNMVQFRKGKKIAYIVTAIVRHRKDPAGSDSIRLFREDGMEILPGGLAAHETVPGWGFGLDDVIPVGEKLSIVYSSYPSLDGLPRPREAGKQAQLPRDVEKSILALLKPRSEATGPVVAPPPAMDHHGVGRGGSHRGQHRENKRGSRGHRGNPRGHRGRGSHQAESRGGRGHRGGYHGQEAPRGRGPHRADDVALQYGADDGPSSSSRGQHHGAAGGHSNTREASMPAAERSGRGTSGGSPAQVEGQPGQKRPRGTSVGMESQIHESRRQLIEGMNRDRQGQPAPGPPGR